MNRDQRQQAKRARRAARAAKDLKAQQVTAEREKVRAERPIYTPEQLAQMQRLVGSAREVRIVARPERGKRILEELGHPSNVWIDSSIWET